MAIWNRQPVPTAGRGIMAVTREPLVSSDIVGSPHAAIVGFVADNRVVDGDLCSVYSWYDNEFGYNQFTSQSRGRSRPPFATRKRLP